MCGGLLERYFHALFEDTKLVWEFTWSLVSSDLGPEVSQLGFGVTSISQHLEILLVIGEERWILLLGKKILDVQTLKLLLIKLILQVKDERVVSVRLDDFGAF